MLVVDRRRRCRRGGDWLIHVFLHGGAIFWLSLAGGCDTRGGTSLVPSGEAPATSVTTLLQPLHIQLTGTEHRWRAEYLASDGTLAAIELPSGGRDLPVPVGANVVLILKSMDYIYTMAIPEFGLKEIAVPDLEFRMTLRPTRIGQFPLIGDELCGASGQAGPGRLIVEPRDTFQTRLRRPSLAP